MTTSLDGDDSFMTIFVDSYPVRDHGRVTIKGYVIEGSPDNPPVFKYTKEGLVYTGGIGTLTTPDGKRVKLRHIYRYKNKRDYVDFYLNLEIHNTISFLDFINNEEISLKFNLEKKVLDKESTLNRIKVLEELDEEIKINGEQTVLEKYSK